jgi:hypothetical protein
MTWLGLVGLGGGGLALVLALVWYGLHRETRARREAEARAWAAWCATRRRADREPPEEGS